MSRNSYFKSYMLSEFIGLVEELPPEELEKFTKYCNSNGKTLSAVMMYVHKVLMNITGTFEKIRSEIPVDIQRSNSISSGNEIYRWSIDNSGIVYPKSCNYWLTSLRYFCSGDENSDYIDITVDSVDANVDFGEHPEYYVRFIKFLLVNSPRIVSDIHVLYRSRIGELMNDPDWREKVSIACEDVCRELLIAKQEAFSTVVAKLQFGGYSDKEILSAFVQLIGDADELF